MTACHCDDGPTFDEDYEFLDETGFVCTGCDSNVYYDAEREDEEGYLVR